MTDSPGYPEGAELLQKTMQDALANLDKIKEDMRLEQEKAIDMQLAAQEELKQIQRDAERLATDAYLAKMNEHIADLRRDIYIDTLQKLILAGIPSDKLQLALEVPADIMGKVWFDIGFDKINEHFIGHVGYKSMGRAGKVIFYRNDRVVQFDYEFGGGDAVAILSIPTAEQWVAQTGITLEERDETLTFMAKRIQRDQVPDGKYFIGPTDIIFMKQ
jgi:hypothetical protein